MLRGRVRPSLVTAASFVILWGALSLPVGITAKWTVADKIAELLRPYLSPQATVLVLYVGGSPLLALPFVVLIWRWLWPVLRRHVAPLPAEKVLYAKKERPPKRAEVAGVLLRAEYGIVEFLWDIRVRERELLEGWCKDSAPAEVLLFTGPGGAGKTRLFIEWTDELRRKGWAAGFLPERAEDEQLADVVDCPLPTFAVVDYAECRPDLGRLMALVQERGARGTRPLRVALLARDVGDWWGSLVQQHSFLNAARVVRLGAVSVEGDLRRSVFVTGRREFAKYLNSTVPDREPDLRSDLFGRTLYLHAAALADVEALPTNADGLIETIVNREVGLWGRRYADALGGDNLGVAEFARRAKRFMAAVTLLGGVATRTKGDSLCRAVGGPEDQTALPFLAGLYGVHDRSGGQYVGPLEPDLLGEALVRQTLGEADDVEAYIGNAFHDADEDQVRTGFMVVGRIYLRGDERAREWMERLLACDVPRYARPAFRAALALSEESERCPLGRVLADGVQAHDMHKLAQECYAAIPEHTVSLRELAAWATQSLLSRTGRGDAERRAALLNNLGNRLSDLGRREDALKAAQEAVGMYRALADERPDAFGPHLAMSLNNLGRPLRDLGRHEEALDAAREAVAIYRQAGQQHRGTSWTALAVSLNSSAALLGDLGRREEALAAAQEAVGMYRALADERADAFRPDLALSLSNLGNFLNALGFHAEALEAADEAVRVYRELATQRPDAFRPDLEASLSNLSNRLSELGRHEQALQAAEESLSICRQLARQRPGAFRPDLAASLNNLGNRLSKLGLKDEALAVAREALGIRRELAEGLPAAFLPALAMSLNNVANRLGDLARHAEALEAAEEAVGVLRRLAEERPDAFRPYLAQCLNNLGNALSELGRRGEALKAAEEAVDIHRNLAQRRPDACRPDLAMSLNNLGALLSDLGRGAEALAAMDEAVDLYRKLAEQYPDAFRPHLSMSLNNLSGCLSELGRREDALEAAQEAVSTYTTLVRRRPAAHLQHFLIALRNLGERVSACARRPESDEMFREATDLLRELGRETNSGPGEA